MTFGSITLKMTGETIPRGYQIFVKRPDKKVVLLVF